ncbi:TetR/AcrR family transcriptional regulator [Hamadaea sp. NPDC051192]|uniref:TetR/AcrR family transcriptional regulator n=1 Tax=Hamadaea sp. NPDC051192 TaxID=3154940 RepID=UPI0034265019
MATTPRWEPRRLSAVKVELPEGVTPGGTRGRILLGGLQLFAELGFHGTSIRDLGSAAGINSATLYAHYPSKEHILAELVLLGHQAMHERLQQAVLDAPAGPAEQLRALVTAHVYVHTDFPLLALVANAELHALSPAQAAPSLALREQTQQLALGVVQRGIDAGVFQVPDAYLATAAVSAMGVRVASWFGPDQPYRREQIAQSYADFALRVVGATSADASPADSTPAEKER